MNKQAKNLCPHGDPYCEGGTNCAACGGHICSHWTATYDIKTGKVYHVACAKYVNGKRN